MIYKKALLFSMFLFISIPITFAQNQEAEGSKAILLDKAVLSGIGLKKITLRDKPEKAFFQKRLYRGEDISVYVVSSESGVNAFSNFAFDEFIQILHGEATVLANTEDEQSFYTRDFFFAPKGFTGDWEIKAGNNYHYELSVISTQRADSTQKSRNLKHSIFSNAQLSGTQINLEDKAFYNEVLRQGPELTVKLQAEKPRQVSLDSTQEKLIHILSGQINVSNQEGEAQIFYTGDYFVLPKGFTGDWESKGHSIVKYIVVEKTK